MIWVFIIAALVLSYIPLINKKIALSNYIWLLIPIDVYGIKIAGTTIKPYMIFAVVLALITCAKNKGTNFEFSASKGQLLAGLVSVGLVIITVITQPEISAVKAALMAVVVYICAQLYVSSVNTEDTHNLSDVIIATCFGYGIVYIVAYIILMSGFELDSICSFTREDAGLFLQNRNVVNGKFVSIYRLRGFAYDPNTMFLPFFFAITACITNMFKKFRFYHAFTYVVSLVCILISGSRMGLICYFLTTAITCIYCIIKTSDTKKRAVSLISIGGVLIAIIIFLMTKVGRYHASKLLASYSNRSGLTDEYGRFSIWKDCLEVFWNDNPFTGVGPGQMQYYSSTGRMTHNTWLEFLCEFGLIVGGFAIIYFLGVAVYGWVNTRKFAPTDPVFVTYICLLTGYTMTIVALTTVDNYTCSYLWISALLILKLISDRNTIHSSKELSKNTIQ